MAELPSWVDLGDHGIWQRPAEKPTVGQFFDQTWADAQRVSNQDANIRNYMEAFDAVNDRIRQATGEALDNPMAWSGGPIAALQAATAYSRQGVEQIDPVRDWRRRIGELRTKHPDKLPWDEIENEPSRLAWEKMRATREKTTEMSEALGMVEGSQVPLVGKIPIAGPILGTGPAFLYNLAHSPRYTLAQLGAGFGAQMTSPLDATVNLMSFGAGGAAKSILRNAAINAAVNASGQALLSAPKQISYREAGLPYGWEVWANEVGSAAVMGGVIDAMVRYPARTLLRRYGRDVPAGEMFSKNTERAGFFTDLPKTLDLPERPPVRETENVSRETWDKAKAGDVEALKEVATKTGAIEDPAVKGALDYAELGGAIDDAMIQRFREMGIDHGEGLRTVATVMANPERFARVPEVRSDGAPLLREEGHQLMARNEAEVRQVTAGLDARIARGVELGLEAGLPSVVAAVRDAVDRVGADGADKARAGLLEALAKASQDMGGPQRMADHIAIHASTDVLEVAAAMRRAPDLVDKTVPMSTDFARAAYAVSKLAEDAFARVAAGDVPAKLGELVANEVPPEHQARVLDDLKKAAPRSVQEARAMLDDLLPSERPRSEMPLDGGARVDDPAGPEAKAQTERLVEEHAEAIAEAEAPIKERKKLESRIEDLKGEIAKLEMEANEGKLAAIRDGDKLAAIAPEPSKLSQLRRELLDAENQLLALKAERVADDPSALYKLVMESAAVRRQRDLDDAIRSALRFAGRILPEGSKVEVKPDAEMVYVARDQTKIDALKARGSELLRGEPDQRAIAEAQQIARALETEERGTRYLLDASSDPRTGEIALALHALDPAARIGHEGVHTLVTLGHISPEELAMLAKASRDAKVFKAEWSVAGKRFDDFEAAKLHADANGIAHDDIIPYGEARYRKAYKDRANLEAIIEEEAAAHLIEAVVAGKVKVNLPATLLDHIKALIERIRSYLNGAGFHTPEDVIHAIVSGEAARRTAREAWMRKQDYSAVAVKDVVQPDALAALADAETGRSMRRDLDALGYYSRALEAAKSLKQAKGTPEQMLAMLKAAGARDAEIEATGLGEFLKAKAARPEPDGLQPQGQGNEVSRVLAETPEYKRAEAAAVKAFNDDLDENATTYFDRHVEHDDNGDRLPLDAYYPSLYRSDWASILPATVRAVEAGASALGYNLAMSRGNTGSQYGTITVNGAKKKVRVADHEMQSRLHDGADFNISPNSMTPMQFFEALVRLVQTKPRRKAQTSVTRDEIVEHLTQNRVGLNERVYADTNEVERKALREQLREARRSSEPNFQRIAELESRLSDIGMDDTDKVKTSVVSDGQQLFALSHGHGRAIDDIDPKQAVEALREFGIKAKDERNAVTAIQAARLISEVTGLDRTAVGRMLNVRRLGAEPESGMAGSFRGFGRWLGGTVRLNEGTADGSVAVHEFGHAIDQAARMKRFGKSMASTRASRLETIADLAVMVPGVNIIGGPARIAIGLLDRYMMSGRLLAPRMRDAYPWMTARVAEGFSDLAMALKAGAESADEFARGYANRAGNEAALWDAYRTAQAVQDSAWTKYENEYAAGRDTTAARSEWYEAMAAKRAAGEQWIAAVDANATAPSVIAGSLAADGGRHGKYYTQPAELFARAFEVYVRDKARTIYSEQDLNRILGVERPAKFYIARGTEQHAAVIAAFDKIFAGVRANVEDAGNGALPHDVLFAFAGEHAKTADHDALAQAKRMEAEGKPREAIWTETGWFRGVDGKWRFEIDDSVASVRNSFMDAVHSKSTASMNDPKARTAFGAIYTNLRGAANHPDLFSAYPQMQSMPFGGWIEKGPSGKAVSGQFGGWDRPDAMQVAAPDARGFKDGIVHEGQHGIQLIEGFGGGASPREGAGIGVIGEVTPESMSMYRRTAGEVEARAVQKRLDLTPDQRRARPPWLDYDVPEDQQIVRFADGQAQRTGDDGQLFAINDDDGKIVAFPSRKMPEGYRPAEARDVEAVVMDALTRPTLTAAEILQAVRPISTFMTQRYGLTNMKMPIRDPHAYGNTVLAMARAFRSLEENIGQTPQWPALGLYVRDRGMFRVFDDGYDVRGGIEIPVGASQKKIEDFFRDSGIWQTRRPPDNDLFAIRTPLHDEMELQDRMGMLADLARACR